MAATSYEAKVMTAAVLMLCQCAAFRTLTGATTTQEAMAYVIKSWGGDAKRTRNEERITFADGVSRSLPSSYAIIDMGDDGMETEEIGVASDDYRGSVMMTIYVPRQLTSAETAPDAIERARNLQGTIRTEYRAQFGGTNCLAKCSRFGAPAVLPPDAEGAYADKIQIPLDFDWYA